MTRCAKRDLLGGHIRVGFFSVIRGDKARDVR